MGVKSTALIIFGFGGLGTIMALVVEQLYVQGIVVDEMVTGTITITDVMVAIILLFMLTGVVIAAMRG